MTKNPLTISKAFKIIEAFKIPNEETISQEIVRRTNLSWSFAQNTINQLHKKGYLTKAELKGRTKTITLTEKGKKIYYLLKELKPLLE